MSTSNHQGWRSRIEATYKAKDVEEIIDIWYYRPLGYAIAVAGYKLDMHPNTISVIGLVVGILAGHLFYYQDIWLNILGIVCWMAGQAFDGADGQLARMTDKRSKMGRVLDGLSDSFKFLSVYIHLGLRLVAEGGSPLLVFAAVFAAMWFHSAQSAFADYYRNLYLFFVYDPRKGELDHSEQISAEFSEFSWRRDFWKKFFWLFYLPYTKMQEKLSGSVDELREATLAKYGTEIPQSIKDEYRRVNKPNIMWYNALTTNTRMLVLYASLFLGNVWIYIIADLTYFNLVLLIMKVRQRRINEEIRELVRLTPPVASSATITSD